MLILLLINSSYLVNRPNSYVIPQGSYDLTFRFAPQGEFIARIGTSPFKNFAYSISYGAQNLIGSGSPSYQKYPEIHVKIGNVYSPFSFAIGYDSQKYSSFTTEGYGVIGFNMWKSIIPCIGVNYSKNLQTFCGAEIGLFNPLNLVLEGILHDKNFTLNGGLRWIFKQNASIELIFENILNPRPVRILKISYTEYI